jgi:hypothetical protein
MLIYPSIANAELQAASQKGMLTITNMIIEQELKKRYSIENSVCNEGLNNKQLRDCLYLYLYALSTWCCDTDAYNFITEKELIAIVAKIEELQQVCCDYNSSVSEPHLAPSVPLVHNGIWTELELTNPLTIAELATATTGALLWYDVETGGTGSPTAPNLPTIPNIYYYWVSQVNSIGESRRLKIKVTILPQKVTSSGLTACIATGIGAIVPIEFNGIDVGATVQIFEGTTPVPYPLDVDTTVAQNHTYTVYQTLNGLNSVPTTFPITVKQSLVLGTITGLTAPIVGTQFISTYSVQPVVGAVDYVWTYPDGTIAHGTSITATFDHIETYTFTVYAISADGCLSNIQQIQVTPVTGLINTHYTDKTNEQTVGRVYSGNQHILINPNDTVGFTMQVIDNPIGAVITPNGGNVTSATSDTFHPFSIDASGTYQAGTVKIRFTLISSTLGATIDSPSFVDIEHTFASVVHCPPGYTLSPDQSYCYLDETMPATITQSDYCLTSSRRSEYTNALSRIYTPGFAVASTGSWTPPASDVFATMANIPQWKNSGATNGPMNRAGVWIDSNCDGTKDSLTLGAQTTLACNIVNSGIARTIYVGIGADNYYQLKVNGTNVITSGASGINFYIWHLFPITIQSGVNYINAVGTGDGGVNDSIGMVVYDNTALEIQNATDDSQLNILFTTANLIGQHIDVATCPPGWSLDISGGQGNYICKRTLTTPPIP